MKQGSALEIIINLLTCEVINFPTLLCTFCCSLKNPLLHLHQRVVPLILFILDIVVMHSILLKTQVKKDIGKISTQSIYQLGEEKAQHVFPIQ